jgi:opacity protein-like surface antigen
MKKFNLSLVAILAMGTFAMAGGDIAPVEPMVETPMAYKSSAGFYAGLAYGALDGKWDPDTSYSRDSDTFDELMIQAGYKFNEYIAIEGRYWFGVGDNTWASGTAYEQDVSVDAWGIYAKPMYPVSEAFNVYALLGYGAVSLDYDIGDTDFDDNDGFTWGAGVEYSVNDNVAVFVDYVSLFDDDKNVLGANGDLTVDTVNVGVTYKF